jgi:hypothetical protein
MAKDAYVDSPPQRGHYLYCGISRLQFGYRKLAVKAIDSINYQPGESGRTVKAWPEGPITSALLFLIEYA